MKDMNQSDPCTAVLDVGGTCVKHAVFAQGRLLPERQNISQIDETAGADAIADALAACMEGADRACLCFPGPFDYHQGISLMKHKFRSLYGVNLMQMLEDRAGIPCFFAHDVVAFLAGVLSLGEGAHARCPAAVTLGTGLGYAYAREGIIQVNALGSPVHPLWNESLGTGILEDHVSGRGLAAQYALLTGRRLNAREIARYARSGDPAAMGVFDHMCEVLSQALDRRAQEDGIDTVILGGQICHSSELFLSRLQQKCTIPVRVTDHLTEAALIGAYSMA